MPASGLVSIVIPTRNRPESLRKALETISRQSYRNYEIIVVDDGSELELAKAIKGYPTKRIVRQKHAGAAVARNNGFARSRGEFLLFCDDDVELHPSFLEKMVRALEANTQKDFAYCGFELDGKVFGMKPFDADRLREDNYINTVSLIRRSKFPGFDPRIRRLQDWDLWLTILEKGGEGVRVPEALFRRTSENKPSISDDWNPEGWTYAHAYDVVRRKHKLPSPTKALEVLARTYNSRKDLQLAYPEAEVGDYRRLWTWASDVSSKRALDPACRDMLQHKRFYEEMRIKSLEQLGRAETEASRKDAEISSLRREVERLSDQLESSHRLILTREEELARSFRELATIRSSIAWRLVLAYRTVLNAYFPVGTSRRTLLDNLFRVSLEFLGRFSGILGGLQLRQESTHGRRAQRDVYEDWKRNVAKRLAGPRAEDHARKSSVDVVITVFNASGDLQKCVASVLAGTSEPYQLVVIDDASTDPGLMRYLDDLGKHHPVTVIRNKENLGYVKSANLGLGVSGNDVVLLNSDAIVPPGWLDRLWQCAYSRPSIGVVSPFSNRATICSIPRFCKDNELPPDFDVNSFAQLVDRLSKRTYPALPTAVGFCMYTKRDVFNAIGPFDESFSPGYGEENDFCMRAYAADYVSVLDDSTFVYHKGRASFDISGEGIARDHFELMGKKHPKYPRLVESFIAENPLRPLQDSITHALLEHYRSKLKKILYIVHAPLEDRAAGGTETHCRDLVENLHDTISYVLYPHDSSLFLEEYSPLGRQVSKYPKTWNEPNPIRNCQAEETLARILEEFKIDLVHVQHLLFLPLSLVNVAKQRGVKVILSCHDGYYACVQYALLENGLNYCYGCIDLDRCDSCLHKQYGLPKGFQTTWRESSRRVLEACDVIVMPSRSTFEIYDKVLDASSEKVRIISHGIRKPNMQGLQPRNPYQEGVLRIGFIGNARERAKGRDMIVNLVKANKRDDIEWHFFGRRVDITEWLPILASKSRARVFAHDSLKRNLPEMLLQEGIHLVVLPYLGFETYSLALSEVWAAGIPAVVPDIVALGERMRQHGGGWLYEYGTPSQKILALIEEIMQNPEQYWEAVHRTRQIPITDTAECTRAYEDLYDSLLGNGNEQ